MCAALPRDRLTVLVVDDEHEIREPLGMALRREGYEVLTADEGSAALARLEAHRIDAVVLDVALPVLDGLETCRRIRASGSRVGVLMLTARDSVDDRVAGLEAGADDSLAKPFALRELFARLRAITRRLERGGGAGPAEVRAYAGVRLDRGAHRAWRGDRELGLTRTEFVLLDFLLEHAGRVRSRAEIRTQVWGYDFGGTSNSLGVYVGYLRAKLEAGGEPRIVHTVRGVGYVLRAG